MAKENKDHIVKNNSNQLHHQKLVDEIYHYNTKVSERIGDSFFSTNLKKNEKQKPPPE